MQTRVSLSGLRQRFPQISLSRGAMGGSIGSERSEILSIVFKLYQLKRRTSEQGLTLMECLVAIMVIAIILAVIAPPILLSAATRVQNQRVEQATQLAQGEADRIRLLVEQGQYFATDLPPSSTTNPIQNTPAPDAISDLNNNNPNNPTAPRTSPTQSFSVKLVRDSNTPPTPPTPPEFVVQTFRGQEQAVSPTITTPAAFIMGVRVYSSRAFANGARPTRTDPTPIGFTSGENLQRPLAVLYIPIVRSDQLFSLCKYQKFIRNDSTYSCQ